MTGDEVRHRIASLCASTPFGFVQAKTPFSWDLQPSGEIDEVFRIDTTEAGVIGGFNYSEERTDVITIWVARKHAMDPEATYDRLRCDASSLRAAVIRDGSVTSGEYSVPDDGSGIAISREPRTEFAVLRLDLPVNYELSF